MERRTFLVLFWYWLLCLSSRTGNQNSPGIHMYTCVCSQNQLSTESYFQKINTALFPVCVSRFAPHLKVMTYGSGGKEARESQREEISSVVAQQRGGWTKASFPFHIMLCHYEVSIKHFTQCVDSPIVRINICTLKSVHDTD